MKKLITLLSAILFLNFVEAQEDTTQVSTDTTTFNLGSLKIILVNNDTGNEEDDMELEEENETNDISLESSFDIGANGYLMPNNSITLPNSLSVYQIDYSRSRDFAINFLVHGLDIVKNHFYISPGIGLDYNSYFFKNNLTVSTNNDTTLLVLDSLITYDKYKLRSTFLQVPLLVGLKFGNPDKKQIRLSFGAIAGFKIGSIVKEKHTLEGKKYKNKIEDDFNINPFRLSATARIGIGDFGVFANYSLTTIFENNKAPELYPFSVGFTFGGF